jgi:aryl-alcohol dehydrogenase-like predicted oxidoreductase
MTLTDYRTFGRSGLVMSPQTLGTMTFGTSRWGAEEDASRAIFNAYVDAGGNTVDTADIYSGGRSEEMVGRFIEERSLRERIVLVTKSGFSREAGNPNAGGNGAKNIRASLEQSLRRLRTNYIDVLIAHAWDIATPAEEALQTFGDLIRVGKIRYFGLSNAPAWYVAKIATLAAARGVPGPIALQVEYSLTERSIENEHVPAARDLGIGIMPWSPLDGGFLTGKYKREIVEAQDPNERGQALPDAVGAAAKPSSRLSGANPFGGTKFTPRNWAILETLRQVATEAGQSPARVALAWLSAQPGVCTVVLGASRAEQIVDNIAALEVDLTEPQLQALNSAGALDPVYPYPIASPAVNRMMFGGATVRPWSS